MLSVQNKTRIKTPNIHFEKIADYVMGYRYDLSLVFIGDKKSNTLNKKYRKKDSPTDILSFPYGKMDGEIFINLSRIKKDAQKSNTSLNKYTIYIFIHGLLHLKGFSHNSTMDKKERGLLIKFSK